MHGLIIVYYIKVESKAIVSLYGLEDVFEFPFMLSLSTVVKAHRDAHHLRPPPRSGSQEAIIYIPTNAQQTPQSMASPAGVAGCWQIGIFQLDNHFLGRLEGEVVQRYRTESTNITCIPTHTDNKTTANKTANRCACYTRNALYLKSSS